MLDLEKAVQTTRYKFTFNGKHRFYVQKHHLEKSTSGSFSSQLIAQSARLSKLCEKSWKRLRIKEAQQTQPQHDAARGELQNTRKTSNNAE